MRSQFSSIALKYFLEMACAVFTNLLNVFFQLACELKKIKWFLNYESIKSEFYSNIAVCLSTYQIGKNDQSGLSRYGGHRLNKSVSITIYEISNISS